MYNLAANRITNGIFKKVLLLVSYMLRCFTLLYIRLKYKTNELIIGKGSIMYATYNISGGGKRNKICVDSDTKIKNCKFFIKGDDNVIYIGKRCNITHSTFWIQDNGCKIEIGDGTTVGNNCQFAAIEGTTISVGKDCMFSHNIRLRTGDSHSIVDAQGKRTNYSKDITIGNHVWVGLESLILKGCVISDNSVIAARATVNKTFDQPGLIIAGAPAKQIKDRINWDRRRL